MLQEYRPESSKYLNFIVLAQFTHRSYTGRKRRMRKASCCPKEGLNRGAWTSEEDKLLSDYILAHGLGRWRSLPANAGKSIWFCNSKPNNLITAVSEKHKMEILFPWSMSMHVTCRIWMTNLSFRLQRKIRVTDTEADLWSLRLCLVSLLHSSNLLETSCKRSVFPIQQPKAVNAKNCNFFSFTYLLEIFCMPQSINRH